MKLDEELKAAGHDCDPEEFRALMAAIYLECYGEMPDEQLYRMPDESKRYCNLVRHRSACCDLADSVIIGTLQNMRKRSRLKVRSEAS